MFALTKKKASAAVSVCGQTLQLSDPASTTQTLDSALNNEYVNRSRVHRILHPNRISNNYYLQLYHFRNILWVRSIYFSEDRSCSGCWRISNLQGDVCILQFENVTSFGNNLI